MKKLTYAAVLVAGLTGMNIGSAHADTAMAECVAIGGTALGQFLMRAPK